MTPKLLKPIAMAAELGIHVRTLRRYQERRIIPFLKIDGVILFDPEKVHAILVKKFERKAL